MVALRIRHHLDTIERLWYNIGGVFYIGGKDAMPKKEGAGGKPQEYDADSGQYGDGTSSDTQKDKSGESGKPKTSKKKKLCVDTPEATELYDAIKRGEYRDAEQLRRHPTVRELDEMAHAYTKKYGETVNIQTPERQKQRKTWEREFLSQGAMQQTGTDADGRPVYEPTGTVRREHKAVIAIGLPAAGKSSRIANPESARLGAFVFDSDEIKTRIPEFQETGGGAADAVHRESQQVLASALAHFLKGGDRNGDNLVIPVIGDNLGSTDTGRGLIGKWIAPLEAAGYDVEIQFQDADPKASMNRCVARALDTGRIIPSDKLFGYGDKPRAVFEQLKTMTNAKGKPYVRKK